MGKGLTLTGDCRRVAYINYFPKTPFISYFIFTFIPMELNYQAKFNRCTNVFIRFCLVAFQFQKAAIGKR